jgi:hypothetical protein
MYNDIQTARARTLNDENTGEWIGGQGGGKGEGRGGEGVASLAANDAREVVACGLVARHTAGQRNVV